MNSSSGNPPFENYLERLHLSLSASKKDLMLKSLTSRSALAYLHELARDLFMPPVPFVHSTDTDIEYFCVVRPIDKAFSAVLADVRD
jgi:hypothetical protein